MPVISSNFKAPWYLRNPDLQTIASPLFRKVNDIVFRRERIPTTDEDFLDIDWVDINPRKMVLLIHGLEASTGSVYIKGMAKKLSVNNFTVAAMNLRGCSGEINKQLRAYHSGFTDDVNTVINHILNKYDPQELALVGFSLGGNLALKYLGEKSDSLPNKIKKAVAISVPCDLEATAANLDRRKKSLYRNQFLKTLKEKALSGIRHHGFPLSEEKLLSVKSLHEYDDMFTAPLFGFRNAADYYDKCSSGQFIKYISIPTLILTAKDDPFLTPASLPYKECQNQPNVFLETPNHGGHVGFVEDLWKGIYFGEKRVVEWLTGN